MDSLEEGKKRPKPRTPAQDFTNSLAWLQLQIKGFQGSLGPQEQKIRDAVKALKAVEPEKFPALTDAILGRIFWNITVSRHSLECLEGEIIKLREIQRIMKESEKLEIKKEREATKQKNRPSKSPGKGLDRPRSSPKF